MALLHTVNKSPFERNTLESCLRHALDGSSILFIEDGVYALIRGAPCESALTAAASRLSLYVLRPDLEARGIDPGRIVKAVEPVDYHGFVELVVKHDRVQSWL